MAAMPGEDAASVGVRRPPLRTPTGLARSGRRRTVASNPTKNQPTLSRTAEMSAVDIATGVRDAAARRASSNVRKTTWRQAIRPGNRAATRRLGPGLTCALPTSGIDPHPRRPTHRAPAAVIPGTGHRAERTCPRWHGESANLPAQPHPQSTSRELASPASIAAPDVALPRMRSSMAMPTGTGQPALRVQEPHSGSVPVPRHSVPTRDRRPNQGQPEQHPQQPTPAVSRMANPNRSPASTASSRPSLTRVTVNLTPAAKEAAEKLASEQGINLTDTINRALRI